MEVILGQIVKNHLTRMLGVVSIDKAIVHQHSDLSIVLCVLPGTMSPQDCTTLRLCKMVFDYLTKK